MAKQILKKLTKEKVPNKLIATFLVVALTFSNVMSLGVFLISGTKVLASSLSELENQGTLIENTNIEFDSYFISSTGEKIHNTSNKFGESDELYIELDVKNEGYLKNAKIEILDTNFSLAKNLDETDTIQNMNSETKQIDLKQIDAGTNVIYNIPIQSEKNDYFNLNDFSKNNKVRLTGTYVDNNAKETEINKEIIINTEWYGDIEMSLEQEVIKYIPFTTAEGKGVLVQLLIKADIQDKVNSLPIKNTIISTIVPELNGFKPIDVKVASNGTTLTNGKTIDNLEFSQDNYTYNSETGELEILVENKSNQNGHVWSGYKGADEYLVSYIYSAECYDSISGETILNNKLNGEIYAYNTPNRTNPLINFAESDKQFTLNDKIGDMVEYEVSSSYSSINKGYMYTNFENNNANETTYSVNWIASIGYINNEGLVMKSTTPSVSNSENLYDNNNYRSTQISKSNFDKILGENGFIEIYSGETLIGKIDKDITPDENNMLKVSYDDTTDVIIKTSAPIEIGILKIENSKIISKDLKDVYTLNKVKEFKNIIVTLNNKETLIKLEEPSTNIILDLNKDRISATNLNENIEIKVTLQRNDIKYNLFKNPKLYIEFPSFVKDLDIKDLNVVYADGLVLDMKNAKVSSNDVGNVIVIISLTGNQTLYSAKDIIGTQIILNTDILVKELTPTMNAEIKAYIYNEKATEYKVTDENVLTVDGLQVGFATKTLNAVAPKGIITKGTVSNFNKDNNVMTTDEVTGKTVEVKIDTYSSKKTAKMELSMFNNYGKDCEDVRILGRIPSKENKSIVSLTDLGSTFDTILKSEIISSGIDSNKVKIYYSENVNATDDLTTPANGWKQDITNAKSYLIILENYTLQQGEGLVFDYEFEIPENLEFEESSVGTYAVLFNNDEQNPSIFEYAEAPNIKLTTGEGPSLTIQTSSTADTIVHEGQIITYTVKVTNTGLTDAKNVIIKNIIPEGTTYIKYEETDEDAIDWVKYPGITEITANTIPVIAPGVTQTLEYSVIVEELHGGVTEKNIETYSTVKADEYTGELKSISIMNTIKKAYFIINCDGPLANYGIIKEKSNFKYNIYLEKLSTDSLNNVEMKNIIPDGLEYVDAYVEIYDEVSEQINKDRTNIKYEQGVVTYKVNDMTTNEIIKIVVETKVKPLQEQESSKKIVISATIQADGIEPHVSVIYTQTVLKTSIKYTHIIDKSSNIIKEGEEIEHTFTIENDGLLTVEDVKISIDIPDGVTFVGLEPDYDSFENNKINWILGTLLPGDKYTFKFTVKADELEDGVNSKSIKIDIDITTQDMQAKTSSYTYTIEKLATPTEPDTYLINGTAWLDENRDGIKDNTEKLLSNVQIFLLGKDTQQKLKETITNNNGSYTFTDVPKGEYIVVFMYDAENYELTIHKKSGVSEEVNSDVTDINIIIDGITKKAGVTDTIVVNDSNMYYIDMGLVNKAEFDLSLNKTITSITVKNKNGVQTKYYDDEKLAKFDLHSKYVEGTEVTIEYKISITNEGNVPGYAREIADYLPKDIIFDKDLNGDWKINPDGNVYSSKLTDILIEPGETKDIKLILMKAMTGDNTGLITNTAEISEAYNEKALKDKDSIPGNNAQGEDDISKAEALITIATGGELIYLIIVLIAGTILRSRNIYNK